MVFLEAFLKLESSLQKQCKIITISDSFKNYLINSIEVDAEKVSVISNWSSGRIILQDKEAWGMLAKTGVTPKSQSLYWDMVEISANQLEFLIFKIYC